MDSNLKFYKSSDTDSIGGAITATEIVDDVLNNLFDDVIGDESRTGLTDYRKVFVKNIGLLDVTSIKLWIEVQTTSDDDYIAIATGSTVTGSNPTTDGQSYVTPSSESDPNVIVIGTLVPNAAQNIWIKRVVDPGAGIISNNLATLKISAIIGS